MPSTLPYKPKTPEQIAIMRTCGKILAYIHHKLLPKLIGPQITTKAIDKIVEDYIRQKGVKPSFKGYHNFPATICASVNNAAIHGIPNEYALKEGDIVSIDLGVCYQGYHTDASYTYPVGEVSRKVLHLLRVAKEALHKGIEQTRKGNRVGDISHAIQQYVERNNYTVVEDYGGHGIGETLHQEPNIPNHGIPKTGPPIEEGMVIAIEPIVNQGNKELYVGKDRWTVYTKDRKPSAHFEHTVAVVNGEPEILTL